MLYVGGTRVCRNISVAMLILAWAWIFSGCAGTPIPPPRIIYQSGLTTVQVEHDPAAAASHSQPLQLTPSEIGTLLRGVRVWERRNVIHRLFAGEADKLRAFRDDEIARLAPAISKAFAEATPGERIRFHQSQATDEGLEETTTGWMSVRNSVFYLSLRDVHHIHSPVPEISKYDRQMPDVPETATPFDIMFEPEEFVAAKRTVGAFYAPDQREELQIRYQDALAVMPLYPVTMEH